MVFCGIFTSAKQTNIIPHSRWRGEIESTNPKINGKGKATLANRNPGWVCYVGMNALPQEEAKEQSNHGMHVYLFIGYNQSIKIESYHQER